MPTTGYACPRCKTALEQGANFCANCGADISGVWGPNGEAFGKTIAVEVDSNVDTLGQLLSAATLGEYDIYGELGRGGMAAVYLGLDLALNRKVAIKTMLPELVSREGMVPRFKREAQTAAGLSHPHIIQIYTVKETKQLVYFVMKFIEGRSLESVITEKGPVSIEMAQLLLSQVCGALEYAHKRGVIHRDIKPANIMIDEDGWAIVTDFGIAKVQVDAQNLTATGTAIGTPHYMSPEQFHNKAVTGASDQYSLGIVAYEMLVGKKPFDGATYAEIITQHLFEPAPDIRQLRADVPEHMARIVARMLSKEPSERYPNLDAVVADLGTPQKSEIVRTQMISLVKSGPQKKVRMSVPMSPIPVTRKPAGGTVARTMVEKRPKKKNRSGLLAAAAVLVLGGGGYFGWTVMRPGADVASIVPGAGTQARTDSAPAASVALTQPLPQPATPAPETASVAAETKTPPANTPAVTAPAAPTTGRVTVTNAPSSAVVTLNGRRQTGLTFTARPGTHTLRIEAPGYEPMTRRITVAAGAADEVAFDRRERVAAAPAPVTQRPAPTAAPTQPDNAGLATLRLILTPPASLTIDGSSKGQQSRFSEELVPGTHRISVERDGFVSKDTIITISAGQTATIRLQLTPRP